MILRLDCLISLEYRYNIERFGVPSLELCLAPLGVAPPRIPDLVVIGLAHPENVDHLSPLPSPALPRRLIIASTAPRQRRPRTT